ncbi:MAG: DUF6804 family protein [Cyclobacteriaceae bacterium]
MKIYLFICASLLFLALADLPYGYYTFLRIVITIGACLNIYYEYNKQEKISFWVIIFGLIAILFNPLFQIHLYDKELWAIIDAVCAILFIVAAVRNTNNGKI